MRKIILLLLTVVLLTVMCACSTFEKTEFVEVKISDFDSYTIMDAERDEPLSEILEKADISLLDGDIISVPLDTVFTENSDVEILRLQTGTVEMDGESTTVKLAGGTVADALAETGIELTAKDYINLDLADAFVDDTVIKVMHHTEVKYVYGEEESTVYTDVLTVEDFVKEMGIVPDESIAITPELSAELTDEMTVTVELCNSITVKCDGKEQTLYTVADKVSDILSELEITLGDDDRINCKTEDELTDGMEIVINRVEIKEETVTEVIPFEYDDVIYTNSMNLGETWVETYGVDGEKTLTYLVTYVDGKEESRELKSEEITLEPVNQVTYEGTYEYTGPTIVRQEVLYDCETFSTIVGVTYYYSDGSQQTIYY